MHEDDRTTATQPFKIQHYTLPHILRRAAIVRRPATPSLTNKQDNAQYTIYSFDAYTKLTIAEGCGFMGFLAEQTVEIP